MNEPSWSNPAPDDPLIAVPSGGETRRREKRLDSLLFVDFFYFTEKSVFRILILHAHIVHFSFRGFQTGVECFRGTQLCRIHPLESLEQSLDKFLCPSTRLRTPGQDIPIRCDFLERGDLFLDEFLREQVRLRVCASRKREGERELRGEAVIRSISKSNTREGEGKKIDLKH